MFTVSVLKPEVQGQGASAGWFLHRAPRTGSARSLSPWRGDGSSPCVLTPSVPCRKDVVWDEGHPNDLTLTRLPVSKQGHVPRHLGLGLQHRNLGGATFQPGTGHLELRAGTGQCRWQREPPASSSLLVGSQQPLTLEAAALGDKNGTRWHLPSAHLQILGPGQ